MYFDNGQLIVYKLGTSGDHAFISGMAGTGKSYTIKAIASYWKQKGKNVLFCSNTKQAALNLDANGLTIYKAFNTFPGGLQLDKAGIKRLKNSAAYKADVIIVDEISTCPKHLFSYIARAIKRIESERKYGGKIILIVIGDFYQLPPVHLKGDLVEYAFESDSWKDFNFQYAKLTTSHRQGNSEFFRRLCMIREGIDVAENLEYLKKHTHYMDGEKGYITLCARRKTVKRINQEKIDSLKGECKIYRAKTDSDDFTDSRGVWKKLALKKGTHIMTIYNDPKDKYYNGEFGIVEELLDDKVIVKMHNQIKGCIEFVQVGYHRWDDGENYVEQLPIIPSYAITIHRAQGLTLKSVNIDPDCFAEGQLYVALSRVRDAGDIYITGELKESYVKVNPKVKKFYDELEQQYQATLFQLRVQ